MPVVSVIIPTLNEADGITSVMREIPHQALAQLGFDTDILVVDGGSTDGTVELAQQARAKVVYEPQSGYGRAINTGFHHACGEIMMTVDGDGTYPVEDIPALVELLIQEDLEFITTNRFPLMEPGAMSLRNRIGNRVLGAATRLLFGVPLKDVKSGMWVLRRELLPRLLLRSDTWPFSHELKIEAIRSAGARWREVPIRYRPRQGKVKLEGWQVGTLDLLHLIIKRLKWNYEHRLRL